MKPNITFILCCFLVFPNLSKSAEKKVYGLNEYVRFIDIDLEVPAKLDTGAETASLSARNIKYFKRHGERWVSFKLAIDGSHTRVIERPLEGIDQIKRRADDRGSHDRSLYSNRPVILLTVCMGEASRTIEVNLTDRSAFQFPLLIGSEALTRFDATIDPALRYAIGKPRCASIAQKAE
ncbi:ATP-dependent zinc protease [Pseudomonas viridiflava]|uniref:ATP-dependent zinc protease family protein n=1 Tax=Pseudomonas viridiflava TaxID=33069 RepID=UPI000F07DD19|nr:ATP-dependent zinc protease [Pseudomonas viridiflava]